MKERSTSYENGGTRKMWKNKGAARYRKPPVKRGGGSVTARAWTSANRTGSAVFIDDFTVEWIHNHTTSHWAPVHGNKELNMAAVGRCIWWCHGPKTSGSYTAKGFTQNIKYDDLVWLPPHLYNYVLTFKNVALNGFVNIAYIFGRPWKLLLFFKTNFHRVLCRTETFTGFMEKR